MAPKLFATQRDGSTLVVIPLGELMGVAEHRLNAELDRIADEIRQLRATQLVIDFEKSQYFGSLMLAAMLRMYRLLPASEGKMVLCNVSPMSREVLQVTRLDTRWPVLASRQEALAALNEEG